MDKLNQKWLARFSIALTGRRLDKYGWALDLGSRRVHLFVSAKGLELPQIWITEGPCRSRVDNFGNLRDLRTPFIPVKFIYTLYVHIHSEDSISRRKCDVQKLVNIVKFK